LERKKKKKKFTIAGDEKKPTSNKDVEDKEDKEEKGEDKDEDKEHGETDVKELEDRPLTKEEEEIKFDDPDRKDEPTTAGKTTILRKELVDFPSFVDRDYKYEELVARLFSMIQKPEEKTTVKIKPPIVYKEGTTRTAWANFPQICNSINRQPEHVLQFVLAEVASTGSLDGNGRLLIRGRFQQKHMERILRHYIVEYVQCHTCKSLETKLHKENRLLFMKCDTCGSTRSVAQIKTGFQATTRASRRTANQNKT